MAVVLAGSTLVARATEPPSAELLEFLGEWQTSAGDWVDPAEFDELLDAGDEIDVDTGSAD
jgi:hypothetical protein